MTEKELILHIKGITYNIIDVLVPIQTREVRFKNRHYAFKVYTLKVRKFRNVSYPTAYFDYVECMM